MLALALLSMLERSDRPESAYERLADRADIRGIPPST